MLFNLLFVLNAAPTDNQARGYNGVVSSENELCSKIGLDVLKEGGSAIDSVIATSVCIGTTNFQSSGIGGGGFLIYRDPQGTTTTINFREKAPANAHMDMYNEIAEASSIGGLSVAVPGELRGFQEAHARFGKLPWKRLIDPSIELAHKGWVVNKNFAAKISSHEEWILKNAPLAQIIAPKGVLVKEGDRISRCTYGETLTVIANEGPDAFYHGWIGEEIVKTVQADGGILSMQDLADYEVKVEEPIVGSYRGANVYTVPPPASGPVLLSVLNILENYNDFNTMNPLNYHRTIEAFKHAFAQRAYYGDPDDPIFTNITRITQYFTTKEFAKTAFNKIDDVSNIN